MTSLINNLRQKAESQPDAPFIIFGSETITYRKFLSLINEYSKYLRNRNIRPGQFVGVFQKNNPEFILAYYSLVNCSAVPVLFQPTLSTNKLTYLVNKIKIETVIYHPDFQKIIDEVELKKGSPFNKINLNNLNALPETNQSADKSAPSGVSESTISPTAPFTILFTSGYSGYNRTVVHSEQGFIHNAEKCRHLLPVRNPSRILSTFPLYQYPAVSFFTHTLVMTGSTIVLFSNPQIDEISRTIKDNKVNVLITTPDFGQRLMANEKSDTALLVCLITGDRYADEVLSKTCNGLNIEITQFYGTTETLVTLINRRRVEVNLTATGQPFPSDELRLVNEQGAPVRTDQVGELQVRGGSAMLGYFDELFHPHHFHSDWVRTDDLFSKDADDSFYLVGKKCDFIRRYGYFINPLDIEKVLRESSKIKDVVAVPVHQTEYNDAIKICIIPADDAQLSTDEMMNICQSRLPRFLTPEIVEFYNHFERDQSGKILRNLLNKN